MNLFVNTVNEPNLIYIFMANEFMILGLCTPTVLLILANHVWYYWDLSGTYDHVQAKSLI